MNKIITIRRIRKLQTVLEGGMNDGRDDTIGSF